MRVVLLEKRANRRIVARQDFYHISAYPRSTPSTLAHCVNQARASVFLYILDSTTGHLERFDKFIAAVIAAVMQKGLTQLHDERPKGERWVM